MSKEEKYLFILNMIKNDDGCSDAELERNGFTDFEEVIKEVILKGLEVLLSNGIKVGDIKNEEI